MKYNINAIKSALAPVAQTKPGYMMLACFVAAGTLLAFFRPEMQAQPSYRVLTFPERVSYQRAIEDVYRCHRTSEK